MALALYLDFPQISSLMKTRNFALVALLLSSTALFAQVEHTEHGLITSFNNAQWLWVAFPNTNNPTPKEAVITTTVEPTVSKVGNKWVIKFVDANRPKSAIDIQIAAKQQRIAEIQKTITRIEKEYFVKSNGHGVSETTPEGQQILALKKEAGDLNNETQVLRAQQELQKK
jgi:hypothetical protein